MEKHFCDVCMKEIDENKSTRFELKRNYSPNAHAMFHSICDDCSTRLTKAVLKEVTTIKVEVEINDKSN